MTTKNDEPAFPIPNSYEQHLPGMTLRDYAAIKIAASLWGGTMASGNFKARDEDFAVDVAVAFRMADALIAESLK